MIAHINSLNGREQTIVEHLTNVQKMAEQFGSKIGLRHAAGLAGMLHDVGKYGDAFQEYMQKIKLNPSTVEGTGGDHSTAGAQLLQEFVSEQELNMLIPIVNAILTHHGTLLDYADPQVEEIKLKVRLQKEIPDYTKIKECFFHEYISESAFKEYIQKAVAEIQAFSRKYAKIILQEINREEYRNIALKVSNHVSVFLTKYIYSCLLDADKLDAKAFDEGKSVEPVEAKWSLWAERLEEKLASFEQKNHISVLRKEMSDQCLEVALGEVGIYSLSIPTGGGKTLASLRFALKHLQLHQQHRIIYVVPYTTIIEQNVKEMRKILQHDGEEEVILEHHSNVFEESPVEGNQQELQQIKAMKDNWDAPIIVTTMVQFLNVFYDAKNRNTRRLHNLTNAVIIFDEVQAVPMKSLALFNEAINFLSKMQHTTVVLCTATQPALAHLDNKSSDVTEIIQNIPDVTNAFKRTQIKYLPSNQGWTTEELADFTTEKLQQEGNVLVILNTKTVVRKLLQKIDSENFDVFHLSTSMCPKHREEQLEKMKKSLENPNTRTLCISTQLIEAGVDISFDCVIRSLAGLDSIAQAAGRCNRHGEADVKNVYVFKHREESLKHLKTIEEGGKISNLILRDCQKDDISPLSTNPMTHYFKQLYTQFANETKFPIKEYKSIYHLFFNGMDREGIYQYSNSIQLASTRYEVIESAAISILVPFKDGNELINQLEGYEQIEDFTRFMQSVQKYSINIFPYERKLLEDHGLLKVIELGKQQILTLKDGAYNEQYGLDIEGNSLELLMY